MRVSQSLYHLISRKYSGSSVFIFFEGGSVVVSIEAEDGTEDGTGAGFAAEIGRSPSP